ncbi:MAG: AAA family ATPase, partial [Polaribacter sp.]|nr:AAA family ATPase [Polaribacter sp.]
MKSPARLFYDNFLAFLAVNPTKSQKEVIVKLVQFTVDENQQLFVLKGYAGTGKTTLLSAYAKALTVIKFKSILLAPTGRAAKVISNYAQKNAFTIHKKIFFYANIDGKFT